MMSCSYQQSHNDLAFIWHHTVSYSRRLLELQKNQLVVTFKRHKSPELPSMNLVALGGFNGSQGAIAKSSRILPEELKISHIGFRRDVLVTSRCNFVHAWTDFRQPWQSKLALNREGSMFNCRFPPLDVSPLLTAHCRRASLGIE